MKVFISWAGEQSRQMACLLRDWLPLVIQEVDPWFSQEDIRKGKRWSRELSKNLAECNFGIICCTPKSINSDWVIFEAGALSKFYDDGAVCTLLLGLKPTDIQGPLTEFQHTTADNEQEVKRLVYSMNDYCEHQRPAEYVERVFSTFWNEYREKITYISTIQEPDVKKTMRDNRELLEEILQIIRELPKQIDSSLSEKRKTLPAKMDVNKNSETERLTVITLRFDNDKVDYEYLVLDIQRLLPFYSCISPLHFTTHGCTVQIVLESVIREEEVFHMIRPIHENYAVKVEVDYRDP